MYFKVACGDQDDNDEHNAIHLRNKRKLETITTFTYYQLTQQIRILRTGAELN